MPSRIFVRDDRESEVEVGYTISGGSLPITFWPPESCDPGEPIEVAIEWVHPIPDDKPGIEDVQLTDTERERFDTEVNEDPDTWADDGPDPDDWRDEQFDRALAS